MDWLRDDLLGKADCLTPPIVDVCGTCLGSSDDKVRWNVAAQCAGMRRHAQEHHTCAGSTR